MMSITTEKVSRPPEASLEKAEVRSTPVTPVSPTRAITEKPAVHLQPVGELELPPEVPPKDIPTPPASPVTIITNTQLVTSPAQTPSTPTAPRPPRPPRPKAVAKVERVLQGKEPLSGTYYLDPCLHHPLIHVPHALTSIAEAALSGASAYPKERFNTTTGAPIDGMAKVAKGYLVPPDGRFETDKGGIGVSVAVVDAVGEETADKGRTKARVDVASKKGGVQVDLVSLQVRF